VPAVLARICVYPIKSLDAAEPAAARVLPGGALADDRRFALVDAAGRIVNAKRTAAMHRPAAVFDLDGRRVELGRRGDGAGSTFSLEHDRRDLGEHLSALIGLPLAVVENAQAGFPDDTDAPGPTVVSTATLEAVATWFPGLTVDQVRRRFRANLEIGGVEPFWEDRLYAEAGRGVRFHVGGVAFEGVNPCRRCVVPTRCPDTGEARPDFAAIFAARRRETLPAWATASRFDTFYRLTVNTRPAPDNTGLEVRVGDPVRIGQ
jgi:hypothetical protein